MSNEAQRLKEEDKGRANDYSNLDYSSFCSGLDEISTTMVETWGEEISDIMYSWILKEILV